MAETKIKKELSAPQPGKQADPAKEQRRKTILAAFVMFIPFCIVMYFIFGKDGAKDAAPGEAGLNTSMPDGHSDGIIGNKLKALESVRQQDEQSQRVRSLGDEAFSLSARDVKVPAHSTADPAAQSHRAYQDMTRELNDFYNEPRPDPQVEELRRQVAELNERLSEQDTRLQPDRLKLAEQQFELATKYLQPQAREQTETRTAEVQRGASTPVRRIAERTVSMLSQPIVDTAPVGTEERNTGFLTAVGSSPETIRNAIRACVDGDQVITAGGRVTLRLKEPLLAGNELIPEGTLLYARAEISDQRLHVTVTSIESGGSVLPVDLTAYDTDGQAGVYIPGSTERTALKDAAASMGAAVGSGISFVRSAGQQVAMDAVRGAMTGATQYAASKLREIRVSVKAGYNIYLKSTN